MWLVATVLSNVESTFPSLRKFNWTVLLFSTWKLCLQTHPQPLLPTSRSGSALKGKTLKQNKKICLCIPTWPFNLRRNMLRTSTLAQAVLMPERSSCLVGEMEEKSNQNNCDHQEALP